MSGNCESLQISRESLFPQPARPINIPPDVAAKCDAPSQFENFDRLFRSVIAVPKTVIDRREQDWKKAKAKKRAKKTAE